MIDAKKRSIFVFVSMGIAIGTLCLLAFVPSLRGNTGAQLWGYGFTLVYVIYAYATDDELIQRFLLLSFFAGLAEIAADAWAVKGVEALIYTYPVTPWPGAKIIPPQPMIWESPLYMPFSWTVVFLQTGYISYLLGRKLKLVYATLLTILLGALLVPVYEFLAIKADWWYYDGSKVLLFFTVPVFIILAEGLLMVTVPYFHKITEGNKVKHIPLLGIVQGLMVLLGGVLAFYFMRLF